MCLKIYVPHFNSIICRGGFFWKGGLGVDELSDGGGSQGDLGTFRDMGYLGGQAPFFLFYLMFC